MKFFFIIGAATFLPSLASSVESDCLKQSCPTLVGNTSDSDLQNSGNAKLQNSLENTLSKHQDNFESASAEINNMVSLGNDRLYAGPGSGKQGYQQTNTNIGSQPTYRDNDSGYVPIMPQHLQSSPKSHVDSGDSTNSNPQYSSLPVGLATIVNQDYQQSNQGTGSYSNSQENASENMAQERGSLQNTQTTWPQPSYGANSDKQNNRKRADTQSSGGQGSLSAQEAQHLLELVNQHRSNNGAGPVKYNSALNAVALDQSNYQHSINEMTHSNAKYRDFMGKFDDKRAPCNRGCAENVAVGQTSVDQVHNGWVRSPDHNKNILGKNFNLMGAALVNSYWTQTFGSE